MSYRRKFLCSFLILAGTVHAEIADSRAYPRLIADPESLPKVAERLSRFPNPFRPDPELQAALTGSKPLQEQVTARFVAALPQLKKTLEAPQFNGVVMRRVSEALYRYDFVRSFGLLVEEDRIRFRDIVEQAAKRFLGESPSRFPAGKLTDNIWLDGYASATLTGLAFPELPMAQAWVDYGVRTVRWQLDHAVWEGAWNESPRYHTWALLVLSHFLSALEHRAGVNLWSHPNLKAALEWSIRFSTPRDQVAGKFYGLPAGVPLSPAYGDANFGNEYATVFALYAPHYAQSDPAFSQRLMYFWREAGSPNQSGWSFGINYPLIANPELPASPQPPLQSDFTPSMGHVILRSGSDQPGEVALFMKTGQPGVQHARSDLGGFNIIAHGAPLALSSQSGPYGSKEHENWHRSAEAENSIVFGGRPAHRYAPGALIAFARGTDADYCVADLSAANGVQRLRRHVVFLKPDYFVIWDEIQSSVPARWHLHTPAKRIEWQDHRIVSHTPWGVDLDVEVLLPANTLKPNENEGRFGEWPVGSPRRKRDPYPFHLQKYLFIENQPDSNYLVVLHPRKTGAAGLSAVVTASTPTEARLEVRIGNRTDRITLRTDGASVQRGENAVRTFRLFPCARDVTGELSVQMLPPSTDPSGPNRFTGRLRITNPGVALEGPLWMVLERLPEGVSLVMPDALTDCCPPPGRHAVFLTDEIGAGATLEPRFRFVAPDANFTLPPRFLAGRRY